MNRRSRARGAARSPFRSAKQPRWGAAALPTLAHPVSIRAESIHASRGLRGRHEVSMRNSVLAAAAALLISSMYSVAGAQGPAAQPPGAPQGGRGGGQTFPNRQRQLADPAVIERGKTLYGINC